MRTKRKLVYYCDFCKKHTLTKHSMVVHESHCTLNPARECRMCFEATGVSMSVDERMALAAELKSKMAQAKELARKRESYDIDGSEALTWLLGQVDECPACVLTIIRLADEGCYEVGGFDFNVESEERLKLLREEREKREEQEVYY